MITTWHDRRITPGEILHGQIDDQLLSADFLGSDHCYDIEMTRAMERHERGDARVVPVILRPCDWHHAPFGGLMAVPSDGKPIVKHATLDDGFLEVAKAIRRVIGSIGAPVATPRRPRSAAVTAPTDAPVPRSSNLRVPREYTNNDRHAFLTNAFEYIARYFENSLVELQARHEWVSTVFRPIDGNRFEARAFTSGSERVSCIIWLGGSFGADELYFSFGGVGEGGYNESMSVHDDGYTLFLKPLGMAHVGQNDGSALAMEGAAEYFWDLFVERLR